MLYFSFLIRIMNIIRLVALIQVASSLYDDVMRSQADKFPQLLENLRVLLYQGQFDWKDGAVQSEKWIDQIDWAGKEEYLAAERHVWMAQQQVFLKELCCFKVDVMSYVFKMKCSSTRVASMNF